MISITCMLIISTLQSSIDKMVPKTSYFKMVDIFLIYSFNIVIVIMGIMGTPKWTLRSTEMLSQG